jgi:hypothetical protein
VSETVDRRGQKTREVATNNSQSIAVDRNGDGQAEVSSQASVSVKSSNGAKVSVAISQTVADAYGKVQQSSTSRVS